jgi:hypothetical protein
VERDTAPSPAEQVARLYEEAERQAAEAGERLVGSGGFASLLGMAAENAAALAKLGNDAMDLALRNLRIASRRDVIRLGRQLARAEDKLERILQELEAVSDQLAGTQPEGKANNLGTPKRGGGSRRGSPSGRATGG